MKDLIPNLIAPRRARTGLARRVRTGTAAAALALSWLADARAQPGDEAARADALFKDAMALRSAGHDAEACPKFAESRHLVPDVGVTLYLAQCYERTGRTASAWREFRAAETLAREQDDGRAEVAAQRARSLEPGLCRLTIATSSSSAASGAEVQVDGAIIPPESWNVALAVDPGDHVVTFALPGHALQSFTTHVDPSGAPAVVRIEDPSAAVAAAVPAPAAGSARFPIEASSVAHGDATARWGAAGLVLAGAIGIGMGVWLVTDRVQEVMPDGHLCDFHLRQGARTGAAMAFSLGGIAVISGVALFYVHRPGRREVALAPTMTPGGAGAVLRTTF